ncbi:COP1-like protein [Mya arenaria]|uniref:COP1-like protein n=1 Tax=Mya arenaria TaxID=6604 RepID=A0ABY7GDF1_MYAAR|nr:COP1-like protein [Mya arenaria]
MAGRTQQTTRQVAKPRKRTQPPVFNGVTGSYEDKDSDFLCYKCIKQSLETANRCPKCNFVIEMNELVQKYRSRQDDKRIRLDHQNVPGSLDLAEMVMEESLDLTNVNNLLELLHNRKQQLEDERINEHREKYPYLPDHLVPNSVDPSLPGGSGLSSSQDGFNGNSDGGGLDEFTESLSKFTRFSSFRPLATLSYTSDIYNSSSIVSSIEFDRDCDFFAIAGVTKKIKVFEYGTVVKDAVDIHYPITEMTCNSKISCVTWSSYHKNMLASADYEGAITLWDAFTQQKLRLFQEHEKRCWSVDFNRMDPQHIASGSDDAKVKLWSTNKENSIMSIEAKANVCCVKFNPDSSENNSLYIYYKGLSKQLLTYKFDTVRSVLDKEKKEDDSNEFGSNVVVAANSQGTVKVLELV